MEKSRAINLFERMGHIIEKRGEAGVYLLRLLLRGI
jgi:hypothetical protein